MCGTFYGAEGQVGVSESVFKREPKYGKADGSPTERVSEAEMLLWESLLGSRTLRVENVLSHFIKFTITSLF